MGSEKDSSMAGVCQQRRREPIPTVGYVLEDDEDWAWWAVALDEFEAAQALATDEAIARCLAEEFAAADGPVFRRKSYLEAATSPGSHLKMPKPALPAATETLDVDAAAVRAQTAALAARRELERCRGDTLGRDRAAALRLHVAALRDESCALHLAAHNAELLPPPAPRKFEDSLRALAASVGRHRDPTLDLHMLPRAEALRTVETALAAIADRRAPARRLRIVVGSGVHSPRGPILAPAIRRRLDALGAPYAQDPSLGSLVVYARS